jgi:hypothetical protein
VVFSDEESWGEVEDFTTGGCEIRDLKRRGNWSGGKIAK